jgi:putative zinc finger/helix-turn-helix YgiT family protein
VCDADEVYPLVTDYTVTFQHEDRSYTIRIPDLAIPTCRNCGDQLFTAAAHDRILAALRVQAGLLMPQEIQQQREQLRLSQQDLAEQLGVTTELLQHWEAGEILQPRAMDNLLRLFFESEQARTILHQRLVQRSAPPAPQPQTA